MNEIKYKKFFSKQFGVPIEKVDIEFFIVKRKLYENCDFPQKRVQEFVPASGKVKLSRATRALDEFLRECFVGNEYSEKEKEFEAFQGNYEFKTKDINGKIKEKNDELKAVESLIDKGEDEVISWKRKLDRVQNSVEEEKKNIEL